MCSYLNWIVLILNCFMLNRNSMFEADDAAPTDADLVVGVFLQKSVLPDLVAVGVLVSRDRVVTACLPLVKKVHETGVETYHPTWYIVAFGMDSSDEGRSISSVDCIYGGEEKSRIGEWDLAMLKLKDPFGANSSFLNTESFVHWDIDMDCRAYYYVTDKGSDGSIFLLKSLEVTTFSSSEVSRCSEFASAQIGVNPRSDQLCSFVLRPFSQCEDILPGSPVLCTGSQLIGLVGTSSFALLADRCFFLLNIFSNSTIKYRIPVTSASSSSQPAFVLILTFLYKNFPT